MNNIKYMLKATLTALEPFTIGSGRDDISKFDVLLDAEQKPFIPGTSISGLYRHYLDEVCNVSELDKIFGDPYEEQVGKEKLHMQRMPSIIFYDAFPAGGFQVSLRDNVSIGDDGVAENGEKFDRQIIEAGAKFILRIEFNNEEIDEEKINELIRHLLDGISSGDMRFGYKSNRGNGSFSVSDVRFKRYDLKNELLQYLDFSWDEAGDKYDYAPCTQSRRYAFWRYDLELESFMMVRSYITDAVDPYNENKTVDSEQLTNASGKPVIPGTAWAGVFRHNFKRILTECAYPNVDEIISDIFGYVSKGESDARSSNIIFGESVLDGSHGANRTRTAIDRFTGGSAYKKLFTMRPAFCGTTRLKIWLDNRCKYKELAENLISLTVNDINEGYVTVGGEGSTGGGIFTLKEGCADE